METENKNVLQTITEKYDQIFQAEKKVADFILKNPELAVNANVSELADYSGVSDATVIRLCKHLGYQGYYQMKICLSRDIGRRDLAIRRRDLKETSVGATFKDMAGYIAAIGNIIDEKTFLECMKLIRKCSVLHLAAVGNTSPLCMYCGYRMERIGIRCSFNLQAEYYMNHISLGSPQDVLLAVSWSGTSKSVVQAVNLAKEKGMKTIAVTGYSRSPLARIADYLLLSAEEGGSEGRYSRHSRIAEMAVLEVLLYKMERALKKETDDVTDAEMMLSDTKY